MEPTHVAPLTPEQIAAIAAGGGFARCEDPTTHRRYQLIEEETPTLDDDYFRAKLAEAQADVDRGDIAEWDINEVKQKLRERLANRQVGK